jgi:hypothetical protein
MSLEKSVNAASEARPTHKQDWVYVTIPERDMFDMPFQGIGINRDHYGPGTHLVPPGIAEEILTILARAQAQDMRILQPRKDMKALEALYRNRGAGAVDLTRDNNKNA